jgi:O-acetyl-ADP-ribose deacetylase (regulator of RNase III)
MRPQTCNALFLKGAWSGGSTVSKPLVPLPPEGWQRYREQIWNNPFGKLRYKFNGLHLHLLHGDLLNHVRGAGAILNSANKNLVGPARPEYWMFSTYAGLSVEETIHKAAGPELLQACKQLSYCGEDGIRCRIGQARATSGTASLLPNGYIIHAVAPGWHDYNTSAPKLMETWRASLALAAELGVKVLTAPALGCGTNRAPYEDAAWCAFEAFQDWSSSQKPDLELRMVINSAEAWRAWTNVTFHTFGR